jgi:DNA polymerase-3 subunit gamma/tau
MSYLVLARKWRPGTFAEVVGQEHVTSTLQKAYEKDRLAHAYLFSGPRGCGKTTTARLLAKIINCEDPQGGEPCNKCSSCVSVNSGNHLDMIEIDGASNRGIDEIRDLREKIGYAPSQSRSKIYIIDEVHMLTQQAFNALLKTLEEPPGHVYLIFATTEPHKVPATILSRCQRFNFKRLELAELSGQLIRICDSEKIEYDTEALTLICRRADGSMRDAESLLDQCISAADGKIDLDTVRKVLGLVDSQIVAGLLDAVSRHDRNEALSVVDRVTASGMDLEEFFIGFIEGIRNLLVISVSAGRTEWLDLTSGEIEELSAIAERFQVEDLLFIFRSMSRAHRELKGTSNPRYHIEAAVAEAASWESAVEIGELISRLESGEGGAPAASGNSSAGTSTAEPGPSGGTRTAERSSPAVSSAKADDIASDVTSGIPVIPVKENPLLEALGGKEEWERFLAQVRESKLTVGIWLMSAEVAGIEDGNLILSFSPQNRFAMAMIGDMKNRRLIEGHLEKFYGRKFTVETCETVDLKAGHCDRQAEMEIKVRTQPGAGAREAEQAGEAPAPEDLNAAGAIPGKKAHSAAKKSAAAAKADNPALELIMKTLDAELLD